MEEMKKIPIPITSRISDQIQVVKSLVVADGMYLVTGGAGLGKTYAFAKAFDLLSKEEEYKDNVFFILCPNRVQNEQNGEEYGDQFGLECIVGGDIVSLYNNKFSCVYDKAKDVLKAFEGRTKRLIIDESHKLICDSSYRAGAIQQVEELAKQCKTVIHLTATSRVLEKHYNYDEKFEFVPAEPKTNFEELSVVKCDDIEATLLSTIKKSNADGFKCVVLINSKESIENYKNFLEKSVAGVEMLHSDLKGTEVYNSIIDDSKLPAGCNVLLATSLLECGTNIKDTNVDFIIPVFKSNQYSPDNAIQGFNRIRNKAHNAYILVRKYDYQQEQATEEEASKLVTTKAEKYADLMRTNIEFYLNMGFDKETIVTEVKATLGAMTNNDIAEYRKLIDFNEETLEITINEKRLVKKIFQEVDKSKVSNPVELLEELKGEVRADNYEILEAHELDPNEEDLKLIKKSAKEAKAGAKQKALETILELKGDMYFKSYVLGEIALDDLPADVEGKVKYLLRENKVIKLLQYAIKENVDYYKSIELLEQFEKRKDFLEEVKAIRWKQKNQLPLIDDGTEYYIIRTVMDDVLSSKSRRVTQKKLMELFKELAKKNKKYRTEWNKYAECEDSEKKKKILEKAYSQLLLQISLIYNLSENDKSYLISSFRK